MLYNYSGYKKVKLTIIPFIFFFTFNAVANIQITSPTNGTTFLEGDILNIHAAVSNPANISAVEFYINNVFIGKDAIAPYQIDWISVEGTHLITAKEIAGSCQEQTTLPVQIIIKKNIPPSVQLIQPVTTQPYFSNIPINLEAIASDTDGTVSQVDFYINSIFVGRDTTAPYNFSWKSIPGTFTMVAKATDNKGIVSSSASVSITVDPPVNTPPTIYITHPIDGSSILLGTPVVINASANDSDGSISAVEFFANNTLIGIDTTPPYEITWPGTAGLAHLTANARDNHCAITWSDTIHISVVDPNQPPYSIETISGSCTDPSFCLPIKAILPVNNIIGYDLVLHYDKTKVQPTGIVHFNSDLINPHYVSFVANNIDSLGEIHLSVFLNNVAPANSFLQGIGQMACVEFSKTPGFISNDSAYFFITDLQESYSNGVSSKQATPGYYINLKNMVYKGALTFWTDGSPIKYDASNPSQYLITTIHGTDVSCLNKSAAGIHPDVNGKFSYNISEGTTMQIERDILPTTDVQPVINGMDVNLGYAVLLNDPSFKPTIYQAIALDVNRDGVISAGDISQMNQRSIKTILEFKQKWNYNNTGSSNGQPSKDWIFIDSTLLADPAYQLSATYPDDDGIGFSKYKVPLSPFCLSVPSDVCNSCVAYKEGNLTGILIGDVNGNYDAITADGQIKRSTTGKILLDLTKAKAEKNYADVPVWFTSAEKIRALDFSFRMNEEAITYSGLIHPASYLNDALANEDNVHTLRFTSNSRTDYETDKTVVIIRFLTSDGTIDPHDLTELKGYLNGEPVSFEIQNTISDVSDGIQENAVKIYPNPVKGILSVEVPSRAIVQLIDIQGKEVIKGISVINGKKLEISTGNLKSGLYILKVIQEHTVITKQVIVENN